MPKNATTTARVLILIVYLLVEVMLIAYLNAHVTYCTASTTVHVIKIAMMDVHAHLRLIIVEIPAMRITKIILTNVEINNEFR